MQTQVRPALHIVRTDVEETKSPTGSFGLNTGALANTDYFIAAALRSRSTRGKEFDLWAKQIASSLRKKLDERSVQDLLAKQAQQIEQLVEQVALLNQKIDLLTGEAEEEGADVDFNTALALVREYFSTHKEPTYPDELAERIGISVGQAIEICEVLVKEGQVVA